MIIEKRLLAGGVALLVSGFVLSAIIALDTPTGQSGMTEDEILDLMETQRQNDDMGILAGILVGVGFLLILISFGARRRSGERNTM
ncbi:MAG: hypothetical protein F4W68_00425 [Cenarchaeum sp. SB0661_bin_35]|nr:hypothetical protein [Cenarchaeum sp. SB0661_bin_35]MYI51865.1 hypothetical protein [Cenarchaeum sp. SB0673_bin_9]